MFPFLWLLQMSVKPDKDIFAFPPKFIFRPTLNHYISLWETDFRRSFSNSAIASVTSTFLSLFLGVPAAYALSRARFRHERKIALWVLASRMAPPIAFTIPLFLIFRYLDMSDTLSGLIIIYLTFNLSLVIWMMRTFFDGVPKSLEEAAWIDGVSVWGGVLKDCPAPFGAGPGRHGHFLLSFLLERFFLCSHSHPNPGHDSACGGGQFYELRRLGMGKNRRRGNHGNAAGGRIFRVCPEIFNPGVDRRGH